MKSLGPGLFAAALGAGPALLNFGIGGAAPKADAVVVAAAPSGGDGPAWCAEADNAPVHRKTGGKGGIAARLHAGASVVVLAEAGSWWNVAYAATGGAGTGWIKDRYLVECEPEVGADAVTGLHPFGRPTGAFSEAVLLESAGFDALHDPALKVSRWVGYCFRPSENNLPRNSGFFADRRLPEGRRAEPDDYKGLYKQDMTGFDKGHQAPDATIKVLGEDAQKETYALSNITPQYSLLNQGLWSDLEAAVRRWATATEPVCVETGPVFTAGKPLDLRGPNKVAVPDAYFAVVIQGKAPDVLAFEIPNEPVSRAWSEAGRFLVSVDKIEADTSLDLLPGLKDDDEARIEAEVAEGVWE